MNVLPGTLSVVRVWQRGHVTVTSCQVVAHAVTDERAISTNAITTALDVDVLLVMGRVSTFGSGLRDIIALLFHGPALEP
jgi:hypothetical protein